MPRQFDAEFFERCYGLRLRIGAIGRFEGRPFEVTGQSGPHILGRFLDDRSQAGPLHPTWHIEWTPVVTES